MNIAVCVKSAVDEAELGADPSGHPRLRGAATKINAFDRNAVEEALRQRERDANGGTVTVVTLGAADARKAVREALAMGGDKAILVLADVVPDALGTAWGIAKCISDLGGVDLVVCSEGASDTYQGQVGAMVAEFLDMPFLPYAKKVEAGGGKVRCEASSEGGGVRVSEAALPAVVSVVPETNVPRYPTLLQLMHAAKKPVEEVQFSSIKGPEYPETGIEVLEVTAQPANRKRVLFDGPPEEAARKLVDALRQEGVL